MIVGAHIAERCLNSIPVVPIHVIGELGLELRRRSSLPASPAAHLHLEPPEEPPRRGVARASTSPGRAPPRVRSVRSGGNALPNPRGRSGEPLGAARIRCLRTSCRPEARWGRGRRPRHYHIVEPVDHGTQTHPPSHPPHLGNIRGLSYGGRGRPEFPSEDNRLSLRYPATAGTAAHPLPDAPSDQALLGHDPADPSSGMVVPDDFRPSQILRCPCLSRLSAKSCTMSRRSPAHLPRRRIAAPAW